MPRSSALLAAIIALLFLPAAAETIAVTTPVYQGMAGTEAKKLTARFEEGLRKAGAEVVDHFGESRGAEFVTSLVVERKGKDIHLSALVTRVRRDTWAAREDGTANGHDDAALEAALDDLAARVAVTARNAPPRQAGAPPAPARAAKLKIRLQESEASERANAPAVTPPGATPPASTPPADAAAATDAGDAGDDAGSPDDTAP